MSDFEATQQGVTWLEDYPSFLELAGKFYNTTVKPEAVFDYDAGRHVGWGMNADIHEIDGLAIKLSTPTTGRSNYNAYSFNYGKKPPEDLVGQFRFLNSLGQHLRKHDDINVPDQYFALNGPNGNLRAEQRMVGWVSLGDLAIDRQYSSEEQLRLNRAAESRIIGAIGLSPLRLGLDFGGRTFNANVLVPQDADNPESAPLYIIDQPTKFITNSKIVALLTAQSRLASRSRKSKA